MASIKTINGYTVYSGVVKTISISSSGWSATSTSGLYTQTLTIQEVSSESKVDIQMDNSLLQQMITDQCKALYIVNNNGTVQIFAIGNPLSQTISIQIHIDEVKQL